MDANDVLALGLGVTPPWRLVSQRLDTATQPNQLHLEVAAERGALFPCPACGMWSNAWWPEAPGVCEFSSFAAEPPKA